MVTTTRQDSAGIVIITSTGPDREATGEFRLDFRLGGRESGPESFYQLHPWRVSVGSSGTIAVLNGQAHEVAVFDSDGGYVATHGRQGEGPGEFRYPSSVAVHPGGAVDVYDYQKRSLVRFAGDGTVLEEARLTVPFNGVGMVSTGGGLVLLSEMRPRGPGPVARRILHLSREDTVQLGARVDGTSRTVEYRTCGVTMSQPPLFEAELVWASNGFRTAVAVGPEYSVWVYDDTTLVHVLRRDIEPEVATEAVARREVGDGERWDIGGRPCIVPTDEVLEQRGFAEAVPVIEAVAVTPDGGLWVKRRIAGTVARSVDVFDPEGRYVSTFPSGMPFPVAFLPDGRLVAIEKDGLDVETVAVYEVGRVDGGA